MWISLCACQWPAPRSHTRLTRPLYSKAMNALMNFSRNKRTEQPVML